MMKKLSLLLPLLLLAAAPAAAQSGFALKGHYLYNSEAIQGTDSLPSANGFSVGAELVLPLGIGIGVSGHTAGGVDEFEVETESLVVVAEANYFLDLPFVPVSPYVGVHAGMGHYSRSDVGGDRDHKLQDTERSQLGYQAGVRVQLTPLLGLDAQWRRVSASTSAGQDGRLERNQVLLGVTLF